MRKVRKDRPEEYNFRASLIKSDHDNSGVQIVSSFNEKGFEKFIANFIDYNTGEEIYLGEFEHFSIYSSSSTVERKCFFSSIDGYKNLIDILKKSRVINRIKNKLHNLRTEMMWRNYINKERDKIIAIKHRKIFTATQYCTIKQQPIL